MADEEAVNEAADLVTPFEGFSSAPYRDPAGVWTIGFGSTRDATGNPVTAATPPVTRDEALQLVRRDLMSAFATISADVHVVLDDHQKAALADFIYNLGAGNFGASTLLRKLNAGDISGAADQLLLWDQAGGKVLAGLLRRREAEKQLFEEPEVSPPPAPATPLGKSGFFTQMWQRVRHLF